MIKTNDLADCFPLFLNSVFYGSSADAIDIEDCGIMGFTVTSCIEGPLYPPSTWIMDLAYYELK